jgi:hypothetical protein
MNSHTYNPLFFLVYFAALWSVVCYLISFIGGWYELGRLYAAERPFDGQKWYFQNAALRFAVGYHNILTIGVNTEGLYMAVFPLFRLGHPPLFIPWRDISVQQGKYLWVRVYKFEFRQAPSVSLRLREKLGRKVQMAAGAAWPGDRSTTGAAF